MTGPGTARADAVACRIAEARKATEARFLAAGTALMSALADAERLDKPLAELTGLDGSGALDDLVETFDRFQCEVTDALVTLESSFDPLRDLWRALCRLGSEVTDVSRIVRAMGIVALNARVQVAAIGASDHRGLEVFSRDASALVKDAATALSEVEMQLGRVTSRAEGALRRSETLLREVQRSARLSERLLTESLDDFRLRVTAALASGEGLATDGRAVRTLVSEAVMALQSGDELSQRLAHVEDALGCAAGVDPGWRAHLLNLAAALTRAAVERHHDQVRACLGSLTRAAELNRKLTSSLGGIVPGRDELSGRLVDGMTAMTTLLKEAGQGQSQFLADAESIDEGLTEIRRLFASLDRVEGDIKLTGMNAVIACANLGSEGLPLKEISQQLRQLADQVTHAHKAIRERLAQVAASGDAAQMQLKVGSHHLRGLGRQSLEEAEQGVTGLRALVDLVSAAGAVRPGRGVEDGIAALRRQIADVDVLGREARRALETGSRPPATADADHIAVADALRLGLSIAEEREILDVWAASALERGAEAPAEEEMDEVTLF